MKKQTIYGIHAVTSFLQNQPENAVHLYLQEGRQDDAIHFIANLAIKQQINHEILSKKSITKLVGNEQHQGVALAINKSRVYQEKDLSGLIESVKEPFLLILDGIQDPHNLGACLRSADAAGVTAVVAPKDKSVSITPLVRKVACGAAETIPFIQVTNLVRTLEQLKKQNIWIYGFSDQAKQDIYKTDLTGPIALVLGAEGAGIRRLTGEHCDALLSIPMCGYVSSLNVSVATGICLFEVVRQRML